MTTTALKLTALCLMLLDHIHQFIPNMPMVLTWVGRVSAPLFFFCAAWGFYYTHSRVRYLVNLYLWNIGMALGTYIVTYFVPTGAGMPTNNIFSTIFLAFFIVQIIEDCKAHKIAHAVLLLMALIAVQIISFVSFAFMQSDGVTIYTALLLFAVLTNIWMCEGGVLCVALCAGLYFARNSRKALCLVFTAFSAVYFAMGLAARSSPQIGMTQYQWLMIAALPLMLCYNGKKGRGLKWLFYVFYPAHIYLLYWVGSLLI